MPKEVYKISGKELNRMINEAIEEKILDEKITWTDMFGLKTRKQNRINAISYARQYGELVNKINAIAQEIDRRVELLQSTQSGQMNESVGAFTKLGGILASKGFTKAAAKSFAKRAGKVVGGIGLASIPAFIVGPQNIQAWFQKFNSNRAQVTPKEVISAYDELTEWMRNICQVLQEHPEILGAQQALSDETLNGPEEVQGEGFGVGDAVEMAAGIGMYAIPYVGWALGAVDLAHSIVHAGAEANREGLEQVSNQIKYLNKAVANVNQALQGKSPRKTNQYTQQPVQQQPQQQTQAQFPNGYFVGRPAPFASNDPQQVARMQNYFGLQATGRWDRNTQVAWDNWLRQTYQV